MISWCLTGPVFAQTVTLSANSDIYTYGDDQQAFALWKVPGPGSHSYSLMKFDDADEIWMVSRHLGSRGAVLYKNDTGRIVLRINPAGGATLYPVPSSRGIPVVSEGLGVVYQPGNNDMDSRDENLKSVEDWSRAYAYAGNARSADQKSPNIDITTNVDTRIVFQGWAEKDDLYRAEMSDHLSGFLNQYPQDEIERIIVKIGEQPALVYENTSLTIWVNPQLGYAGRPSSERILQNIKTSRG